MELLKNLISTELTHKIYRVYRNSDNNFEGRERHHPSDIGHFLLSSFTQEELGFVWPELHSLTSEYTPVLYRVLKYTKGCFIDTHVDMPRNSPNPTDHSLIIQLNPTSEFTGGTPHVKDIEQHLNQGDGLIYPYGVDHGVTTVTKGCRYVLNIRMKKTT